MADERSLDATRTALSKALTGANDTIRKRLATALSTGNQGDIERELQRAVALATVLEGQRRSEDADAHRRSMDRLQRRMAWTAYWVLLGLTMVAVGVIVVTVVRRDYGQAGLATGMLGPLLALFGWTWRGVLEPGAEPGLPPGRRRRDGGRSGVAWAAVLLRREAPTIRWRGPPACGECAADEDHDHDHDDVDEVTRGVCQAEAGNTDNSHQVGGNVFRNTAMSLRSASFNPVNETAARIVAGGVCRDIWVGRALPDPTAARP